MNIKLSYFNHFIRALLIVVSFTSMSYGAMCVDVVNGRQASDENFIKNLNAEARSALRKLLKPNEKGREALKNWISGLQSRLQDRKIPTPLEDLTLQLIIKTDFFSDPSYSDSNQAILSLFKESRFAYTGKNDLLKNIIDRPLPKSVIEKLPSQDRHLYELAFKTDGKTLEIKEHWVKTMIGKIAPIGMLGIAFSHTGGPVLSGIALGYFMVVFGDFIAHNYILHASPQVRDMLLKSKVFQNFGEASIEHWWHHSELFPGITPAKYALRFKNDINDPAVQRELVPLMEKAGLTKEQQKSFIEESNHGVYVSKRIQAAAMIGFGAVTGALGWLIGGDIAPIMAPIAAGVSMIYTPFINFNHLPLHFKRTAIVEEQSKLMQWYLDTSFYRTIARRHYMHHLRSNSNYAVMPVGLDRLMGTYKVPTLKDILDMYEADLIF